MNYSDDIIFQRIISPVHFHVNNVINIYVSEIYYDNIA